VNSPLRASRAERGVPAAVGNVARMQPGGEERPAGQPAERVGRLRGAGVEVDARVLGTVVAAALVVALLASGVVLLVAAAHRNSQISDLRDHGIPVQVRVTDCIGVLGGSGSNAAAYTCTGTYERAGHRHTVTLPDSASHDRGSLVKVITVPDDPGLVAEPGTVLAEHASWTRFVVPVVLLGVALVVAAGWALARRRRQAGGV